MRLEQRAQRADGVQHRRLVGDAFEVGRDEVAVPGAGEVDHVGIGHARRAETHDLRAVGAAIAAGLGDLDHLLDRRGGLGEALPGQDFLVVVQAGGSVAERDGELLAGHLHALHQAGKDVGGILDRVLLQVVVERFEQRRGAGHDLRVDDEADIDGGLAKAGLAEQALLQRSGVEGRPLDGDAVLLRPVPGDVAALRTGRDRLHDAVGEDVEWPALRVRRAAQPGEAQSDDTGAELPTIECRPLAHDDPPCGSRVPRWRLLPLRNACSWRPRLPPGRSP